MKTRREFLHHTGALGLGAAIFHAAASPLRAGDPPSGPAAPDDDDRPVIGLEHDGPIRVVYQISRDEQKDGVGAGLYYLRKLHEGYLAAGVDPRRLDIHAVFHGDASHHLLTDDAWNRWRSESSGNPNAAVIADLARRGVSLELCDSRRRSNGWAKSDVHPDAHLVGAAYQRVIDLQLRGYAYIRF